MPTATQIPPRVPLFQGNRHEKLGVSNPCWLPLLNHESHSASYYARRSFARLVFRRDKERPANAKSENRPVERDAIPGLGQSSLVQFVMRSNS